mgnify:CR=1 FL=1
MIKVGVLMDIFFYEDIHRAELDFPYVDMDMHDIDYCTHYHEEIEIVYVVSGKVCLTVDGNSIDVEKGNIALVFPYQIHSLTTPEKSHIYIVKILPSQLDFSRLYIENPVVDEKNESYKKLIELMDVMFEELKSDPKDLVRPLALRTATGSVLLCIARLDGIHKVPRDTIIEHNKNIELLKNVNDFLKEHFKDNLTLETVAAACHLSMYYFAHVFKKAVGTTFLSYLNAFRLEQAKHMIEHGDDSMTHIAMQCGFSSIRTFNRCIYKHYKLTPTEARIKWKN